MKPVDLNTLLNEYYDTELYLAVNKDCTKVVGTGKTIEDAVKVAARHGCFEPIIMHAPSRKKMNDGLGF